MKEGMSAAPLLETARLRLRAYREADLAVQAEMLGDPEVTRHLGGTTLSREESWRRMLCAPGLWALLGYGYWAVERREDGEMIGQVGFADFKREMEPSIEGFPEIGWIFAPRAQGMGYCREAVDAILAWAEHRLAADRIVAIIDPENAPSIRVAERCGFSERQTALYRDEPILLFTRYSRLSRTD
jgi:RimJ/RimL family protein N-acetyltransferase